MTSIGLTCNELRINDDKGESPIESVNSDGWINVHQNSSKIEVKNPNVAKAGGLQSHKLIVTKLFMQPGNKLKASPCAVIHKMHEHRRSLINAPSSFLSGHNIFRECTLQLVILILLKLSDIYCNVYNILRYVLLSGLLFGNSIQRRCR